jgi:hypothetical protein
MTIQRLVLLVAACAVLRKSTLAKKISQLITYMIKNVASSGVHQVYGAVTCYSKWLLVKGEIIDDKDIPFTLHNDVLPLEASVALRRVR